MSSIFRDCERRENQLPVAAHETSALNMFHWRKWNRESAAALFLVAVGWLDSCSPQSSLLAATPPEPGAANTGDYRNLFVEAGHLPQQATGKIRFTPDIVNWNHTDPSYHLPAFYELWARWGPAKDTEFWSQTAGASRDFFQQVTHSVTALAPDYANFDATPWASPWNPHSADFQYDSWRTAMNWSIDWAWWGKDSREQDLSDRLQAFFEAQGLASYGSRFTLDGHPFGQEHTTGLVAMNAVASLAARHPRARQFVEALWNTPIPAGPRRYYDGMLYLLALLHCGGEFRVWAPR
jgi:endo-1,4-beta-D-glucanase Y